MLGVSEAWVGFQVRIQTPTHLAPGPASITSSLPSPAGAGTGTCGHGGVWAGLWVSARGWGRCRGGRELVGDEQQEMGRPVIRTRERERTRS